MLDVVALVADRFTRSLTQEFQRAFSHSEGPYLEVIENASRMAIERIGISNALYHNFEHTILVTQVGWEILKGKRLHSAVDSIDAAHFLLACLMHDIGYVRGICAGDTREDVVINDAGDTIKLSLDASDAALAPYHVDRSKLFIRERAALVDYIDGERIARAVELTRFPIPNDADHAETDTEAGLVRAADLIGQLADPYYPRKCVALFYEFEETGLNEQLGYSNPGDLIRGYPQFFWNSTYKYIKPGLKYLECTASGRAWTANLFRHVFASEHTRDLAG
ncbi:HD domain-containing protein [Methylocystis bryophila]|uniref:Metal-dependent phosphohydrolase n=1 Tax=Methylocystis bryophila TaxID=655015 RepID=A0A1W6MR92_9HYPH|nr:metal-dependent phosphohydrolase [Methylocystis bryophila]ARN80120.1 metal-dependent phosphohydrolase [Methylocystis bryophila]BDV40061.1 metal-dependent phosphohydrolase [Methylocystis bryophila]